MNLESSETTDYAPRVAAGVAFLGEHRPNWRERVTAKNVQVNRPNDCPLGLTYGYNYWFVLTYLRDMGAIASGVPLTKWAEDHGFSAVEDLDDDDNDEAWDRGFAEWSALQRAWVTELQRDQAAETSE
jgi:hypothetical protein